MINKINLEKFIKGEIAIHCNNFLEIQKMSKYCKANNLKWSNSNTGSKYNFDDIWYIAFYEADNKVCFSNKGNGAFDGLVWNDIKFYLDNKIPIVECTDCF